VGWLVEQEALSEGVGHAQAYIWSRATPGTSAITYNVITYIWHHLQLTSLTTDITYNWHHLQLTSLTTDFTYNWLYLYLTLPITDFTFIWFYLKQ
jgi:hypothetical protein